MKKISEAILDHISEGVVITDTNNIVLQANRPSKDFLKVTIGKHISNEIDKYHLNNVYKNHKMTLGRGKNKKPVSLSKYDDKKDGKRKVFIFKDMTELAAAEEDYKTSEEEFKALVDAVPDIIYRINDKGRFTFLNRAIVHLGYTPEELIGKHYKAILHPDDIQHVSRQYVLPKLMGQITGDEESPKLFDERRDGVRCTKNLQLRIVPKGWSKKTAKRFASFTVLGELNATGEYLDNKFLGTMGIIRDVTDHVKLENRWRKYEFIVNSAGEHMSLINRDYTYEAVNDSFCNTMDKARDEIIGKTIADIWGKNIFKNEIKGSIDQCFSNNKVHYQDKFKFGKLGYRYMDVTFYPYCSDGNCTSRNVSHAVIVSKDITEEKKAEQVNKDYTELIKKNLLEKEDSIKSAQLVQRNLNPKYLPNIRTLDIISCYMPSEDLGGDFFDVRKIGNTLIMIIADCTGHGIEASMKATLLKAISDRHIGLLEIEAPHKFLEKVNQDMLSYVSEYKFDTMFACSIDTKTNELYYANANAKLPYIISKDGKVRMVDNPEGFHLGVSHDTLYEKKHLIMKEGEILFLFSDAIVEIPMEKKGYFNNKSLERLLPKLGNGLTKDLDFLMCNLKKENKGLPLGDDTTIILVENTGVIQKKHILHSLDRLDKLKENITKTLGRFHYSKGDISNIIVSFVEIINNSYKHGNKSNPAKKILLSYSIDCERSVITVEDEGEGFDSRQILDPTGRYREKFTSGRGIYIINAYMDDVQFNKKGNRITITKNRTPIETVFKYFDEDENEN